MPKPLIFAVSLRSENAQKWLELHSLNRFSVISIILLRFYVETRGLMGHLSASIAAHDPAVVVEVVLNVSKPEPDRLSDLVVG